MVTYWSHSPLPDAVLAGEPDLTDEPALCRFQTQLGSVLSHYFSAFPLGYVGQM